MRDVKRARLATLGVVLAAGLALAACGGGTSHAASVSTGITTTTTTAGGGAGRGAALAAFTSCMSSHGVKITVPTRPRGNGAPPSTTPGETRPARTGAGNGGGFGGGFATRFDTPPAGVDPTKYSAALAACKSKLPTGGGGFQNNTAFQAYTSCLRDHGVTLPGNRGGGNGGTATSTTPTTGTSPTTTFNRNDPKVQAALKTCQPLLPAGGFGRSTTTTSTAPSA